MKRILLVLFAVFCVMMIASCDTTTNPGNNTQDPSLDGIDISKFEMPQTEFMHDGHELSKLEEVFKLVIEKGTFVYDKNLNSIGYKLELKKEASTTIYAYYSVSELRIIYLEMQGKVAHSTYFKLDDQADTFAMCHKIQYFSGRRQDFLGIMNYNRIDFDGVKHLRANGQTLHTGTACSAEIGDLSQVFVHTMVGSFRLHRHGRQYTQYHCQTQQPCGTALEVLFHRNSS